MIRKVKKVKYKGKKMGVYSAGEEEVDVKVREVKER